MTWTQHVGRDSGVVHLFAPRRFPKKNREDAARLWDWTEQVAEGKAHDGLRSEIIEIASRIGGTAEDVDAQLHTAEGLDARRSDARRSFEHFGELDEVLAGWPLRHGHLLACLAGLGQNWRRPMLDDLWRSSFLAKRLILLPREAASLLWIPKREIETVGADPERLIRGEPGEAERQLVWKQLVRIRERLVHTLPLSQDLGRPFRRGFKQYWFGLLELLDEIERRDFDVWTEEVRLSDRQRRIVGLQSLLTRATFKRV